MIKLKFGLLPAHWGTSGKTRERMEAEYNLTGFELEIRLLEISKDDFSDDEYDRKRWDIELKYGKLTEHDYHRYMITLIRDEKQKSLALLELGKKDGSISDLEYAKQTATLHNEPWVTVIRMDFNGKNSLEGSFELDWNEPFVNKLKTEGYTGATADVIVNHWFMEVCRNVAMEEFDGTGDFTSDSAANLDAVKRWSNDSTDMPVGKKGYK